MIDFIFQVDLSIVYIVQRRDYIAPTDRFGTTTLPLGGKFYYTAAEANTAARQYCLREAAKNFCNERTVIHGEKDALYRGTCIVKDQGRGGPRDRFEVIVRRLQAGSGDNGAVRGESRGSVMVGTAGARVGEERRGSWGESSFRPGTRDGRSGSFGEETARNRCSGVGERRPGTAVLRPVEEEDFSSGTDGSGSPGLKRRSLMGRFLGTLMRK